MKATIIRILLLIFIAGGSFVAGVMRGQETWDARSVTLKRDFDLGANYFFAGSRRKAPIVGIVSAGEAVHVTMKKGGAAYISVSTVVPMSQLNEAANKEKTQ